MEIHIMTSEVRTCFWCGGEANHSCYTPKNGESYSCDFCCMVSTDIECGSKDFSEDEIHKWVELVRLNLWRLQGIEE